VTDKKFDKIDTSFPSASEAKFEGWLALMLSGKES
jgi:hypothetical protein